MIPVGADRRTEVGRMGGRKGDGRGQKWDGLNQCVILTSLQCSP
jgi:hypothetical protein